MKRIAPLLLFPVLFTSCVVRSLQPIYTEADLIAMPAIEGTWKGEDEGQTVTFAKEKEGKGYLFTLSEGKDSVTGQAHFATIGKRTYMDVTLAESMFDRETEKEKEEVEKTFAPFFYYAVPVHMIYQVEVKDSVLRMRTMNYAWVKDRRDKGHLWIAHYGDGESTLLTADTARVQRFLRRWENTDEAWGSWNETPLVPIRAAPSTPTP